MSCTRSCTHMSHIIDIPIKEILNKIQKFRCQDCNCIGPNLWMCLYHDCLSIGCSEEFNDHNTLHNAINPSHCIHMNLSTHRIWCYMCKSEVFMESKQRGCDSDGEPEECTLKSGDSGRASYTSTLQSNSADHSIPVFGFDRTVGLNVGMSGDTSESSDTEDGSIVPNRPLGLVGLQNIGNTCYLNAALQALSNTIPLTKFFLDCPATVMIVSEGRKPGLSRTYQLLMTDMWLKKNGGYVIPSGILYGIRNVHAMFRGYHQHDTQEFLRNFMDQLHEELKQIWLPDSTSADLESYSTAIDEPTTHSSNYDSSEGEYETCDSGVSERSSLSDDMERVPAATNNSSNNSACSSKRRLSRSASPSRRLRTRFQNTVIENQPTSNSSNSGSCNNANKSKQQLKHKSIISDIFDGKLLSTVQCLTCNRVSSRVETFQDLSLPIPSRDHLAVIHGRNAASSPTGHTHTSSGSNTPAVVGSTCTEAVLPADNGWIAWILIWIKSWFYGPTITLHDCLAAFFSTDELKGDNMYSCERCNKLRNGIKYSKVLQLPEVLCIHLKRFRHELMFSSKISSTVSFPLKGLDMRPYLHTDCVSHVTNYELFSVICHHGTAGGGHYTCYALNSGQWYEFDDQCVTRVSAETVQNCEAYVLFYRKVTPESNSIKAKVMELSAACNSNDEETFYISRQWFSRFHTCAEPGPIDNRDFLCQHGYITPERAKAIDQLAVAIPKSVYNYLYKKYGGNAPTTTMVCSHCHAHQRRLDLELETLMQLNLASQKQQDPSTHLLSKSWYGSWLNYVQRKSPDPPGPIDNGKSTYISQLADYAEINEDIWKFFHSIYGGGPEIRLNNKQFADQNSNCESSDCNTIDARAPSQQEFANTPPISSSMSKKDDDKINNRIVNGCHGEPMDVEDNRVIEETTDPSIIKTETGNKNEENPTVTIDEIATTDSTSTMSTAISENHVDMVVTCNCNHLNNGGILSSGASNTSLTDEEIQSEKSPTRDSTNIRIQLCS